MKQETRDGAFRRRMTRREWLERVVLVAGAASGGALMGRAEATPRASITAATAPAGTPAAPAGTLTVSLPARLVSLDPLGVSAAEEPTKVIAAHLFDKLIVRSPKGPAYLPGLATKWETPDPLTWVFTLRGGVKFHDGSPLTAADVKGSLERLIGLNGPWAPLWAAVDTVEAPNDGTVRIKTKTPLGTMLPNMSLLSVVPVGKVNQPGFFTRPIGSGPFRIVSYQPDNELVLEANPGYWGPAPGVRTLRFKDVPEIAARVTALITGEIDFTYGLPPDQLAALAARKDLRVVSAPSFTYYFIWMNCKREVFTDARVRQAMTYALDVNTMVTTLMKGIGRRMTAPIASTIFGYAPQRPYAYDPTGAKQLLAAAGRQNGFECTMIWNPDSGPQDRELAQALFSYWGAIGVRVRDGQSERAQWLDRNIHLDWDMDFQTIGDTTGDADYVLGRLYTTRANRNGYSNPRLDQVLDAAAQSVDQAKRKLLYAEACAIIWDNAVGIYPIELLQSFAYRQGVEGFVSNPSFPTFTSVTVKR